MLGVGLVDELLFLRNDVSFVGLGRICFWHLLENFGNFMNGGLKEKNSH